MLVGHEIQKGSQLACCLLSDEAKLVHILLQTLCCYDVGSEGGNVVEDVAVVCVSKSELKIVQRCALAELPQLELPEERRAKASNNGLKIPIVSVEAGQGPHGSFDTNIALLLIIITLLVVVCVRHSAQVETLPAVVTL